MLFENFSILISWEDYSRSNFICLMMVNSLYIETLSLPYIFFLLILSISAFNLKVMLLISIWFQFFQKNWGLFASILLVKYYWTIVASSQRLGFSWIIAISLGIIWLLLYPQLNSLAPFLFQWIEGMRIFTIYFLEYRHALLLCFSFSLIGLDYSKYNFVDP
jgi:hypothetical protein